LSNIRRPSMSISYAMMLSSKSRMRSPTKPLSGIFRQETTFLGNFYDAVDEKKWCETTATSYARKEGKHQDILKEHTMLCLARLLYVKRVTNGNPKTVLAGGNIRMRCSYSSSLRLHLWDIMVESYGFTSPPLR
jgi:hypothetical protein